MNQFIQFFHQGGEAAESKLAVGETRAWTSEGHVRKFMEQEGSILLENASAPIQAQLHFWGEWEAPSMLLAKNTDGEPTYLWKPIYEPSTEKTSNTDPYVFGKNFYYCVCKQGSYPFLKELNPGDLILFGSHKANHFVLDTVFVVKRKVCDYNPQKPKFKDTFPEMFIKVSINPLRDPGCANPEELFAIYEAASYDDQVNGMFSFVPAMIKSENWGFKRPHLGAIAEISSSQTQGINALGHKSVDTPSIWEQVVNEVYKQGLGLGIHIKEVE